MYIWEHTDWPHFHHDLTTLQPLLGRVHLKRGELIGRMRDVGLSERQEVHLYSLTDEIDHSHAIEGERLDSRQVRSSLARHLGLERAGLPRSSKEIDAVVEMMLEATAHFDHPLTTERLFAWHAALFPTGYSGLVPIRVGLFRNDEKGPMQVVSGPIHRPKVHFEAPPADRLIQEVDQFLTWFNQISLDMDPLLRAGIAHLWFLTLHPFDEGNGRIARTIGEMALAYADGLPWRYYSLSAQIERNRKAYYQQLEQTQKGSLDITEWLTWFLEQLFSAIEQAHERIDAVLFKACFWRHWGHVPMNSRQIKVLNRLLDGFEGKLTSRKWAALAKCSQDTAIRDIRDLLDKGLLCKGEGGGRSTHYVLTKLENSQSEM